MKRIRIVTVKTPHIFLTIWGCRCFRAGVFTLKQFFWVALFLSMGVIPVRSDVQLKLATQDFPPFSYLAEGSSDDRKVLGPAAEIIGVVCDRMEISYELRLLPWRRAQYDMREEGLYNGLFLIGKNQSRLEYLHFSPPILKTEYGFFVKSDNDLIYTDVSDLKGYRVAVYGPSNTSKSLEKLLGDTKLFSIDMRPDDISGFKKLSVGRVEAVYSNRDVGFALLKSLKIENATYAGRHRELNYYIGFSKKYADKGVIDRFNKGFVDLYEEGLIQTILEKYHLDPARIE